MISKDVKGNEYEISKSDLVWRPSAYGVVIHDGKILLVNVDGKYHLPGGGIDLGEDPKEALLREIKEETGIVAKNPKLLDANSSFFTWESTETNHKLFHAHSILLYYLCDFNGGHLGDMTLDDYEKLIGQTAEWVSVLSLKNCIIGTTVDWRPIIESVINR